MWVLVSSARLTLLLFRACKLHLRTYAEVVKGCLKKVPVIGVSSDIGNCVKPQGRWNDKDFDFLVRDACSAVEVGESSSVTLPVKPGGCCALALVIGP